MRSTKPIQQQLIKDQRLADEAFKPDRIIHHIKCIYPVIAALRLERRFICSVCLILHAVDHEPSIGFGKPRGRDGTAGPTASPLCAYRQAILGYANPVVKDWGDESIEEGGTQRILIKSFL